MILGYNALRHLWIHAGGPPAVAGKMAAISLAESGGGRHPFGDHYQRQGYTSWGLWQIHTRDASACLVNTAPGMHPYDEARLAFDPMYNAHAAVAVYRSQGLGAWSTYQTGAYLRFLPRTSAVRARAKGKAHPIAHAAPAARKAPLPQVAHPPHPAVVALAFSPSDVFLSVMVLLGGVVLLWRLAGEAKRAMERAIREEIAVRRRAVRRRESRDQAAFARRTRPRALQARPA